LTQNNYYGFVITWYRIIGLDLGCVLAGFFHFEEIYIFLKAQQPIILSKA